MVRLQKINISILAFFLFVSGMVKFGEPFKTMFINQIETSELPFRTFTLVSGQTGEILIGLLLFGLLFFWKRFPSDLVNKLFKIGNLLVFPIMLIAIYVHLLPQVPAGVFLFESKLPFLAIILIVLSALNLYLQRTKPDVNL